MSPDLAERWRRPTREMLLGLPCLTLWRPWPTRIVHPDQLHPKRVENRTWHPPKRLVGQLLGIHAGGTLDYELDHESPDFGGRVTEAMVEHSRVKFALVGVAYLFGSTTTCPPGQERWWVGPVGWELESPVCFDEPIPMKGSQGVWTIDEARLDGTPSPPPTPDRQRSLFGEDGHG